MSEISPQVQPRRSIRRLLIVGSTGVSLLMLLAGSVLLWQVNRLSIAAAAFQQANAQAKAALKAQQASTDLIATVSQLLPLEDAEIFEAELSDVLANLYTSRDELVMFADPASDNPINQEISRAVTTIDSLIGIAETMLNQANMEQWPSARIRMGILIRDQQLFANQTNQLVEQTNQTEIQSAQQLTSARRAAVLYPALALGIATALVILMSLRVRQNIIAPITQLTSVVSQIATGALDQRTGITSEDEFGQLGQAFNHMADQIQTAHAELEGRVAERTRQLERRAIQLQAAAEVGHAAVTIRDLDALLSQVTHLISDRFGFYHAGVFFIDDQGEFAVLRAANSEGGQRMLARGHKLKVGQVGIVGHVTAHLEPRIALDVGQDAVYFDNPDLPETRSEMALPLMIGGKLLGALDVQSKRAAAFSDEDVAVLQVLADQVAVAIENARLFTDNQEALEATRRAYGELSRASWGELLRTQSQLGFIASSTQETSLANEEWTPDMIAARNSGDITHADSHTMSIPIVLRDQVLGIVRLKKPSDAPAWTTDEINLMNNLIDQLEIALESARLYRDTQRRAERERMVTEITTKIRSTTDPKIMVQTAINELREALQAQRGQMVIRPIEPE